jgi:hypothetical protein
VGNERAYQQESPTTNRDGDALRPTIGKSTLAEREGMFAPVVGDKGKAPDFEVGLEHNVGSIKTAGKLKVDIRDSSLVKAKYGSVSVGVAELKGSVMSELGKISQSVSAVLLNPKWEGGAFEAPLDKISPVFEAKAFELKIKNGELDWSLLTLGFKLKGDLTELLPPDLRTLGLALTIEVGIEKKLVPNDVGALSKLTELMGKAFKWAEELRKWKDDLAVANNLKDALKKRAAELMEAIKKESRNGGSKLLRTLQREHTSVTKQLLLRGEEAATAARRLKVLGKIGVKLGEKFVSLITKLSPAVRAVEGAIVRALGSRLVLFLGANILRYAHPFIFFAMLAYDLYCLACLIRDYCRGYAGFGFDGDEYDPLERSWADKPASATGDSSREGAETSSTPLPDLTQEKKSELAKAGGPRKRLFDLVRRNAVDNALDDKQLARLIDILASVELTDEMVDKILPYLNPSMTPDQALDALARALAGAKLTDKDVPSGGGGTEARKTGGGGSEDKKPKSTGGGGDKRDGAGTTPRTSGRYTLDADDGGKFVGGGTGTLALNPERYKTYAVYTHSSGVQIRIAGRYIPRADGTTEFRPYATGVRVVNKRVIVNGKPGKEKIGEVLVKSSYVVR